MPTKLPPRLLAGPAFDLKLPSTVLGLLPSLALARSPHRLRKFRQRLHLARSGNASAEHLPWIQQVLRVKGPLELLHQLELHRALVAPEVVALGDANAMLGRD
jgi:hypothetical protein